jgi:NCAIR mutase (PurE)-related protein
MNIDLDIERNDRCGFPEFIYGDGKKFQELIVIFEKLINAGQNVLATKISSKLGAELLDKFPEGVFDELAKIFFIQVNKKNIPKGNVTIITAGTTDSAVALEAMYTLQACNCKVKIIADSGVAGIHRLIKNLPKINNADVIIVVAGMEGALPSVVGGFVSCPVIAVPTSVGYGTAFGGVTALLYLVLGFLM